MDPARKRATRLTAALTAALLLAGALVYTSFSAASTAITPSRLLGSAQPGRSYLVSGTVVNGSISRHGDTTDFSVRDRANSTGPAVPIVYSGSVPDPFEQGREVIVNVEKQGSTFVGERDTLVTKCPSKYTPAKPGQ
jgi:cytochrome c-type biogenesis protein CcmE